MCVVYYNVGVGKFVVLVVYGVFVWQWVYGDFLYDVYMFKVVVEFVFVNGMLKLCKWIEQVFGWLVECVVWY